RRLGDIDFGVEAYGEGRRAGLFATGVPASVEGARTAVPLREFEGVVSHLEARGLELTAQFVCTSTQICRRGRIVEGHPRRETSFLIDIQPHIDAPEPVGGQRHLEAGGPAYQPALNLRRNLDRRIDCGPRERGGQSGLANSGGGRRRRDV